MLLAANLLFYYNIFPPESLQEPLFSRLFPFHPKARPQKSIRVYYFSHSQYKKTGKTPPVQSFACV